MNSSDLDYMPAVEAARAIRRKELSPVELGQFVADGHGNLSGDRVFSFGGVSVPQTFTRTYSTNPNGTGTATCTILPAAPPEASPS